MVKPRNRETEGGAIEKFIQGGETANTDDNNGPPDANAPRNFKSVKFGMNEYEHQLFTAAARSSGRSLLNFLRHSATEAAKKLP